MIKTLECISNFTAKCELASFGCDLISTARWRGARLADILDLAGGLKPARGRLRGDRRPTSSPARIPLDAATDPDTILVYEMNGAGAAARARLSRPACWCRAATG